MKTVKRKTVRQGTRRMINAQAVTPYGLLTYRGGETAFFLLRPTCISVLPEDALAARVGALVTLFKSQPELEILCLNSRESFANNTRYLEARIGEEENPYIADLLEKIRRTWAAYSFRPRPRGNLCWRCGWRLCGKKKSIRIWRAWKSSSGTRASMFGARTWTM